MSADHDCGLTGSAGSACPAGKRARLPEVAQSPRRALVGALLAWPMQSRAVHAAALGGLMSAATSGFASTGSATTGSATTGSATAGSATASSATAGSATTGSTTSHRASTASTQPAQAELPAASYDQAILRFTGGTRPRSGKVKLDVAVLIDNGNTVPVSVSVGHPMNDDDHVQAIAIFSERNPQHEVLRVDLTPDNGRASVASRIRLATSQKLMAVARLSDGSCWSHEMEVIVTLAACIEGEP